MEKKSHTDLVFETAQKVLPGILSGNYMSIGLVAAMQRSEKTTLGNIICNEAWSMAEDLVELYERRMSESP